jgi:arabinofuranosyltransferase
MAMMLETATPVRDGARSRLFALECVAPIAVFVAISALAALLYSNDCLDDQWITYRYARNLARGAGLVWNVSEKPVEGYTCFSWVLINALLIRLGIFPLLGSKILSLLCTFAMTAAVFSKSNRVVISFVLRVALALLVCTCPVLLFYGQSGMETLLFTSLAFGGTLLWSGSLGQPMRKGTLVAASLLYGLALLTRPEGVLLFVAALAFEIVDHRRHGGGRFSELRRSDVFAFGAPFLAIALTYFAWRLAYYGYVFPNTYYAKHSGNRLNNLPLGVLYVGEAFRNYLVVPITLLVGLLVRGRAQSEGKGTKGKVILPLATIIAVYAGYVMWMGGDDVAAFPSARLLGPVIPIAYLVLARALEESLGEASQRRQAWTGAAVVLLCVLCWTADGLALLKRANPELSTTMRPGSFLGLVGSKLGKLSEEHPGELPSWIRDRTNPADLVAVPWAGRIPYYADRPVLDELGLNDVHIAHVAPRQRGINVKMDPAYVLARKPALIFVNVGSAYLRGEMSFGDAGGWKLGDKELLDLLRVSSDYALVKDVPATISVFERVTREK